MKRWRHTCSKPWRTQLGEKLGEKLDETYWQTSPQDRCGSSRGFKDIENHEYFYNYANKMTTLGQHRASHPLVLDMIAASQCKILDCIEEDVHGDAVDQTLFKGF